MLNNLSEISYPYPWTENIRLLGLREFPSFLVMGKSACAIVEGGVSALAPKILADIEGSEVSAPVKYLVAAHGHADHVMGLMELKFLNPDMVMVGSSETGSILAKEKIIRNFVQDDGMYIQYLRNGGHSLNDAGSSLEPLKLDIIIEDQGTLNLGDVQLKFIGCPGHSPDNRVVQVEPDHAFLLSDTAGYALAGNDILPLFFYNYRGYIDGLEKIKSLKPKHIGLGHNLLISSETESLRFLDLAVNEAGIMREGILRHIQGKVPAEKMENEIADKMTRYGLFKAFSRDTLIGFSRLIIRRATET
jgi:2-aminobenzoylacetyl-CoA thioesterase